MINVERAILMVLKTGKVVVGAEETIKSAKTGKAKIIILSSNCPRNIREDIEYYCKLSEIPIYIYKGTGTDLGMVCNKPFIVSALAVKEPGDSDILKLVEKHEESLESSKTSVFESEESDETE